MQSRALVVAYKEVFLQPCKRQIGKAGMGQERPLLPWLSVRALPSGSRGGELDVGEDQCVQRGATTPRVFLFTADPELLLSSRRRRKPTREPGPCEPFSWRTGTSSPPASAA